MGACWEAVEFPAELRCEDSTPAVPQAAGLEVWSLLLTSQLLSSLCHVSARPDAAYAFSDLQCGSRDNPILE